MSERFFVATPIVGDRAELHGDEARHLAATMRARPGDEVVLFDNSGAEFLARVLEVGKHSVRLQIDARREVARELPQAITLAVALPKGERQKWLIEKATELGVSQIIPLVTKRGIAQPVDGALDRLRRTVIEASKQCGRNRLLEIGSPQSAMHLLGAPPNQATGLIADRLGNPLQAACSASAPIIAAIGPEGGFTPEELQAARAAGWRSVSLGPTILRVETAAIAIAGWAATTGFSVCPELPRAESSG